jgi:hypothetical protein
MADAMDDVNPGLRSWTPVHVTQRGTDPSILWARMNEPLLEPFFELSAERAMRRPFNQLFSRRTGLEALDDFGAGDAVCPAGFIFHQSRCGSTLVAQMLAQLDASAVVSEAQPLDALLRPASRSEPAARETLAVRLRAMVHALTSAQSGARRIVVKWHAWHAFELPLIAAAFPDVPWMFLFREPREILASHEHIEGAESVAGTVDPAYFKAALPAAADSLTYGAGFLGELGRAAIVHAAVGRGAFVRYDTLPDAVFTRILPHFGIEPSDGETLRMRAAARDDAKQPQRAYAPRAISAKPEREERARRWLDAPYAELSRLAEAGR